MPAQHVGGAIHHAGAASTGEPASRTMRAIPRPLFHLAACVALLTGPVGLRPAIATAADAPARVVVVGDIHGNADGLAAILRRADLIDADRRWAGGPATLVQSGDITDRGSQVREAMDLLMRLEREAASAGGRVIVLLGNHEVMNMMRDLRYVTPAIYATFADARSDERREAAYRDDLAWRGRQTVSAGDVGARATSDGGAGDARDAWMRAHPPGYFAYREAFEADGRYGRWLRTKPIVVRIGSTIVLHGGIHPAMAPPGLEAKNTRAHREILTFDGYRRRLIERHLILPGSTFEEILAAARNRLRALEAESAVTAPPDSEAGELGRLLEGVLGVRSWSIVNENGPLWFRGFALWRPEDGGPQITRLLTRYAAARFVVGHSVMRSTRITPRFDDRVFLIDTGMLSSYYPGGRASALEIVGDRVTAIYLDRNVVLVEPSGTAARDRGAVR